MGKTSKAEILLVVKVKVEEVVLVFLIALCRLSLETKMDLEKLAIGQP